MKYENNQQDIMGGEWSDLVVQICPLFQGQTYCLQKCLVWIVLEWFLMFHQPAGHHRSHIFEGSNMNF